MPVNLSGLTTGLMGYSLKKEFLNDSLFFRETEVFNYEIYSLNITGLTYSPAVIHNKITTEFQAKYSGDINVKVFQVQPDYFFPNDTLRSQKFNVQVEVRKVPIHISGSQLELESLYYTGLNYQFFNAYAKGLNDFKEELSFDSSEQGNKSFIHSCSFSLVTGNKNIARSILTGIFDNTKNNGFGNISFPGGMVVGDTGNYVDYFTETSDEIRGSYSYSKKREILPFSGYPFTYNVSHRLEMKEDGLIDVSEAANIKGKNSFAQVQSGCEFLLSQASGRCTGLYFNYKNYLGSYNISDNLILTPKRTSRTFNKLNLTADYDITFTNDSQFASNGVLTEENIDFNVDEKNIIDIKHNFSYSFNKRNPPAGGIENVLATTYSNSAPMISGYYQNSDFYNSSYPIKQIHCNLTWPMKKNKAAASFVYSNHPRYFVNIGGIIFYTLDYKIQNTHPVDIMTEYKVVNRPTKMSVINYAYQTEKGQLQISLDGNLGRNPNEFTAGFRNNVSLALTQLYRYGITLFMQQFANAIPIAFTYQLSDIKYSLNSEGTLSLTMVITYTMKKYII